MSSYHPIAIANPIPNPILHGFGTHHVALEREEAYMNLGHERENVIIPITFDTLLTYFVHTVGISGSSVKV
jgi:hypothetical protein